MYSLEIRKIFIIIIIVYYNKKNMIKKCEKGKIVNPKSGRCVSKTGDIGIKLMINKNSSFKSVDSAILKSSSIHKPGRNIPLQMNLRDLTLLTQKPVNKTKFKGVTNTKTRKKDIFEVV